MSLFCLEKVKEYFRQELPIEWNLYILQGVGKKEWALKMWTMNHSLG
jgi:hypothetical protein